MIGHATRVWFIHAQCVRCARPKLLSASDVCGSCAANLLGWNRGWFMPAGGGFYSSSPLTSPTPIASSSSCDTAST